MFSTIKKIIAWTTRYPPECGRSNSIKDTICMNWRTWLGHANVAVLVVAITGIPCMMFPENMMAGIIACAGYFSVIGFYAWREFGFGGGFYVSKSRSKQMDSIYDFAAPLFAGTFVFFNMDPVFRLISAIAISAITFLFYKRDGKRGNRNI